MSARPKISDHIFSLKYAPVKAGHSVLSDVVTMSQKLPECCSKRTDSDETESADVSAEVPPIAWFVAKKKNTAGKKCANKVSDFTNLPQTIRINDAQTALARILMLLLITANNEINNNYCYSQSPTAAACNLGKCLL